ncbi:NAAT family transporter [Aestuariirhabdus sp. Z084]|uniref:MarC family protein n=1 Tax=Aestuariirhabdus haliotis TaxID=2918751 RepID=UPI00201B4236|nr:MarC family protein [Aestuariirhabdus haliotis]MCL6417716.1 NAAT family transporter [Aestuariirhabdus haliotis]MCL6421653.1 NAAT family transporter [Aestuariirhabdus haliotis]
MSFEALVTFAAAMFTILNPIGASAVFAGMVIGRSETERRSIIVNCTLAIAIILLVTLWGGELVLGFFGVSVPSLEVAGSLIIGMIAISMLNSQQSEIHSVDAGSSAPVSKPSIAFVPLAMPMIAGPGAIATIIVNTQRYHNLESNIQMSLVCIGMAIVVGGCLSSVSAITRLLGESGMEIITKFMGMILLAIAVGMGTGGLKQLMPGLGG